MNKRKISNLMLLGSRIRPLQYFGNFFTITESGKNISNAIINKCNQIKNDNRGLQYIGSCALGAVFEADQHINGIDCINSIGDGNFIKKYLLYRYPD